MREILKRIFLVHKCVSCRKILANDDFESAFCPSCRETYLSSKMAICSECSLEAEKCRCMPTFFKKDKALSLRRLFFYSKKRSREPQNRLIYYLKRNKSKRVSRFVARELVSLINSEVARLGVKGELMLLGVPRSRDAFFEYGFDQADILCLAVSELTGIEYCRALRRRRGKQQKKLTAGERRKNIKNLIYLDKAEAERLNGKTVVLIDDIVTTGASMSACIQSLSKCGIKNVICIAIASDINT